MTGGCLCGGVRFVLERRCATSSICHCSLCRRSGTLAGAYTSVPRDALRLVGGDAHVVRRRQRPATRVLRGMRRVALLVGESADTISVSAGALDGATGWSRRGTSSSRTRPTGSGANGATGPRAEGIDAIAPVRVDVLNGVNLDLLGRRDPVSTATARCRTSRRRSTPGRVSSSSRCGAGRRTTKASTSSSSTPRSAMPTALVAEPGCVEPLQLGDPRRARAVLGGGRRGAPLGRRRPRGVASADRPRGPDDGAHHRRGNRRLPAGARSCSRIGGTDEADRAAAREPRRSPARHGARQRPIPDRPPELERSRAGRPRGRGDALHGLSLRGRAREPWTA